MTLKFKGLILQFLGEYSSKQLENQFIRIHCFQKCNLKYGFGLIFRLAVQFWKVLFQREFFIFKMKKVLTATFKIGICKFVLSYDMLRDFNAILREFGTQNEESVLSYPKIFVLLAKSFTVHVYVFEFFHFWPYSKFK